jgi:hypothetical protein
MSSSQFPQRKKSTSTMTDSVTRRHSKVEPISLDYELCATIHNQIFQIGWEGDGRSQKSCPTQSWWERFAPSTEISNRLNADLVEFFKRAYSRENAPPFFYFLGPLTRCKDLLDDTWFEDRETDRFIILHHATGFRMGDEIGLM